jgi:hypothetical protein
MKKVVTFKILSALELVSLALWVGSLFFICAFLVPYARRTFPGSLVEQWEMVYGAVRPFQGLEIIFACIILISDFFKSRIPFHGTRHHRAALFAATLAAMFTFANVFSLHPAIGDKINQLMNYGAQNVPELERHLTSMIQRAAIMEVVLLGLSLYLLHAWRRAWEHYVSLGLAMTLLDKMEDKP